MFAFLIPLLAGLPGLIGKYFSEKNALEQAKLDTERQIELAKQQMASEIAKGQMELNKTIVQATGSKFKYFTFVMWFGPFMVGTIKPSWSHDIFVNLAAMPEWYVQSCMLIMFTVWGISVSAPVVSGIFSGLGNFFADRKDAKRDFELAKAKINRAAVFEDLRAHLFPKGMNQQEVDIIDNALDEGEK